MFIAVAAEVDAAADSDDEARELAAGDAIKALNQKWSALLGDVAPNERKSIEVQFERRLLDVRRAAAQLTQRVSGQKVERAHDAGSPFLFSRSPPKSIEPDRYALRSKKPTVGHEVEAWCGKCKEIRDHRIVAMVGDEPKQVVCNTCGSRHNFKTEQPTRGKGATAAKPAGEAAPRKGSAEDREQQKRADAKRALQKELGDAVDPKTFDPKARYKAGEIIFHPEHGRGKIENVLRSSLLVRFLDGLKPLDLA